MTESKMTMRELLNAVIANEITDAVIEKATAELAKLDARNEKRTSKPSKVAEANVPLIARPMIKKDKMQELVDNLAFALSQIPAYAMQGNNFN
mgnify:CR=1 FL=1